MAAASGGGIFAKMKGGSMGVKIMDGKASVARMRGEVVCHVAMLQEENGIMPALSGRKGAGRKAGDPGR